MTTPQCKDCRFWQCHLGSWKGWCRRYAPSPLPRSMEPSPTQIVWPETDEEQWCGEFKPRPKAKPELPLPDEAIGEVDFDKLRPWTSFVAQLMGHHVRSALLRALWPTAGIGEAVLLLEDIGWRGFSERVAGSRGDLRSRGWMLLRLLCFRGIGFLRADKILNAMAECGWPFRD